MVSNAAKKSESQKKAPAKVVSVKPEDQATTKPTIVEVPYVAPKQKDNKLVEENVALRLENTTLRLKLDQAERNFNLALKFANMTLEEFRAKIENG